MARRKVKAELTIKDGYVGGADGGGVSGGSSGVGFGIPADYSSGNPISNEDDPKITADGQIKAEVDNDPANGDTSHELLTNLPPISSEPSTEAPPYNYSVTPVEKEGGVTLEVEADGVDVINVNSDASVTQQGHIENTAIRTSFYETYSRLDQSNPIRQRAEKVDIQLANTIQQCDILKERIEQQKELASRTLETVKYVIGEIIRVKNEEPTFERLEKVYSQWIKPLAAIYDETNFKFDDVCPFVSNALDKLHAIPEDSATIPIALDEIVGILDEAMTHLLQVKDEGYGEALLDYYNCVSKQDSITGEVERMAADVAKALKGADRNSFKVNMKQGVLDVMARQKTNQPTTSTATKQTYRLLENLEHDKAKKDTSPIPDSVPNYRLAIDASPRVCGNCRFFSGTEGVNGQCSAFAFTAKANYICDAWQSPNLTSSHTTVRSVTSEEIKEAYMKNRAKTQQDYPLHTKTPVEYVNTNPIPLQGIVVQQDIDDETITDLVYPLEVDRSYNDPESPAPNAAVRTSFLPGDTVYSKSLNSLGVVQGSVVVDGIKTYSIKLINSQGMASGTGYTYGNDLTARSSQAMKTNAKKNDSSTLGYYPDYPDFDPAEVIEYLDDKEIATQSELQSQFGGRWQPIAQMKEDGLLADTSCDIDGNELRKNDEGAMPAYKLGRKANSFSKSIKSIAIKSDDPTLDQMIDVTRSIYKALKAVCEAHADVVNVPLSNKEVLTPLREDMLKALENPIFQGVSTGAKRKYYRAIQTALVSIGAARQVLFEGYKTINVLKKSNTATAKSDMQATMVAAQTDAYERVKYAYGQIKDALTLPSATHGMDAPGIGNSNGEE